MKKSRIRFKSKKALRRAVALLIDQRKVKRREIERLRSLLATRDGALSSYEANLDTALERVSQAERTVAELRERLAKNGTACGRCQAAEREALDKLNTAQNRIEELEGEGRKTGAKEEEARLRHTITSLNVELERVRAEAASSKRLHDALADAHRHLGERMLVVIKERDAALEAAHASSRIQALHHKEDREEIVRLRTELDLKAPVVEVAASRETSAQLSLLTPLQTQQVTPSPLEHLARNAAAQKAALGQAPIRCNHGFVVRRTLEPDGKGISVSVPDCPDPMCDLKGKVEVSS